MTARTRHLGLAGIVAALWLIGASGAASLEPLACDLTITGCFDLTTSGEDITHVFIDSGCGASPSDYEVILDGILVTEVRTTGGPCPHVPRDLWFRLLGHQNTAHVCVSVRGSSFEGLRVFAKAGDACIVGTMPMP